MSYLSTNPTFAELHKVCFESTNSCILNDVQQQFTFLYMRIGMNLEHNYKLSTHGLCKEVILYRSGLCNRVVIKYGLVVFGI